LGAFRPLAEHGLRRVPVKGTGSASGGCLAQRVEVGDQRGGGFFRCYEIGHRVMKKPGSETSTAILADNTQLPGLIKR